MIRKKVIIKNTEGLHARPATQFVKIASKYQSDVFLSKNGREVNGKSIMGVMMLAAAKDTELILIVNGDDEQEAVYELIELINNKFNEEKIDNGKK
ncbi:MAG TPA: HPr family phosphocarrier protein [bacterium]|nr:HPr family phosphocarrier protein [bacterium]